MCDTHHSLLLTDLYQLTMLQAYLDEGLHDTAVFEFFVRRLPQQRNYLLACGLEPALEFLEAARCSEEELQFLRSTGRFRSNVIDYLASFRFRGDVHAVAEGTVVFADEPLLRVTAPLPEAQLVESRLINLLQFPTLVASKAARCVQAAPGKRLVDFGMRRAHGAEAALMAARASYVAGFAGTSNVLAGQRYGIPLYGTMAHSYVQAHEDEQRAFEHFARANPHNVVLLIDTYDTEAAAAEVVRRAAAWKAAGLPIHGVRIDSGDLAEHARRVREILDRGGLRETTIFASSSLDEHVLAALTAAGTPIDGYGVGTRLDVSADVPYLDCAYKLQEYAGVPRRKRSEHKATWPGRKQVYRYFDDGVMVRDLVTTEDDAQDGLPLVQPVMRGGRRLRPPPTLDQIRAHAAENLAALPEPLRSLQRAAQPYTVQIAERLRALAAEVDRHSRA
jgi:nicotinate phosphoribosyltransferase